MTISFNCGFCGKKINAPDSAAGKSGKCPACQNKVLVPAPAQEEDDELRLAPIDHEDEKRQKQMLAETFKLRQSILKETAVPDDEDNKKSAKPKTNIDTKKLATQVINCLQYMVDGELDKADKLAVSLKSFGPEAAEVIDQIAYGEISVPQLKKIPSEVLFGMIKELQGKLH